MTLEEAKAILANMDRVHAINFTIVGPQHVPGDWHAPLRWHEDDRHTLDGSYTAQELIAIATLIQHRVEYNP